VKPPRTRPLRCVALAFAVLAALSVTGCASVPAAGSAGPGLKAPPAAASRTPGDPWESWNRKVYAFNDAVDSAILKPAAQAYEAVVPRLVRTGVGNVLGNIRDVWSAANQLLQGKVQYGFEMGMRVVANSFFGLGGLLDPATEMGLVKRPEDFGQTLGRWGMGSGPYVVPPFVGPSTVRDSAGFLADRTVSPSSLPPTAGGQYSVLAVELVDGRAKVLSATKLLDQVALDRYSFLRDAYLAQRRDAVYDGAPPMETFDEDPGDGPAKPAAAAAKPAAAASSAVSAPNAASSATQ
jgi:phospholipid-binding lipoprotein MlaA